jgi:hypothetical protein
MKKSQQTAVRKSRTPAPLRRAPAVQMARSIYTNHVAQCAKDRLEQEADNAGDRFLRGETGIAGRLSRTGPAAFEAPESRGVPLAWPLRRQLELAFGADLSQVRLHRGAASFQVADELGALAFAAGRDIFFSRRAPDIQSQPGRRLLAHEIAHTIQQAGRVSAGNGVSVANTRGQSRPQLAYKSPLESTPEANRPSFDDLAEKFLSVFANAPKVVAQIKKIRKDRDAAVAANAEDDFWTNLEQKTKDTKDFDNAEREVRSFIFDSLKLMGRIAGASYLLSQDPSLSSTFFVKEVYEQLPDPGYAWLVSFWAGATFFSDSSDKKNPRDFTPKRFVETIYQFLLGATRDIPDLSLNPPFASLVEEELKKRESPEGFIGNELYLITLWTIKEVDRIRQLKLAELARKVAPELLVMKKSHPTQWLSPGHRKNLAKALVAWAQSLAGSSPELESPAEEVKYLYGQLAKAIQETASGVATFWEKVELFQIAIASGQGIEGMKGNPGAILKKFADREEFQKFRRGLSGAANTQFALKAQRADIDDVGEQTIFPSPVEYEKARDNFMKTLRSELYTSFEGRLFLEFRKPMAPPGKDPTSKQLNPVLGLAYGWMASEVYDLLRVLDGYDRASDEAYVSDPVTIGRADLRIQHRDKLAKWLWHFGVAIGWDEFTTLANAVVSSQQAQQHQSQLAILGDWNEDSVPISKLTKDFNPGAMIGAWEPFTFADLVNFYQTVRMQDITKAISDLMSQPNAFDPKQDTLVSRAIRASDEAGKKGHFYPRRFSVKECVVQFRPEDIKEERFAEYIRFHPKTQALLAAEKPVDGDSIAPVQPGQGVFLWIIPSFLPLIKILRGFDEFNGLIYQYWTCKADYTADDLIRVRALDPIPWLNTLSEAITTDSSDKKRLQVQAARAKFAKRLSTDFRGAQTALDQKMREASIQERDTRISSVLEPALREYDRYGQFTPSTTVGGVIYEIPGKVLTRIGAITSAVGPIEDQNPHYAAIFLKLAAVMRLRLSVNPREDVANDYYPAIQVALDVLEKNRAQVLALLPGKDNRWVDAQVEELNALLPILKSKLVTGQRAFGLIGHSEGATQFVTGVSEGDVINAEKDGKRDPFTIDGVMWAIVSVHQNFTFHPKYGVLHSVLIVDEVELPPEKRTSSMVLVTVNLGGKNVPITAAKKDEELLAKLSYAVTMALIVRQLEQLAEFIESFAELTLDALELIPGAGQAVMAARLAIAILTFIASGEAQFFIDQITKDPIGEVKRVLGLLSSLFSPDELWLLLLVGNNKFDQLHSKPRPKDAGKGAPKGLIAKFLRLMSRIWNIGEGILGSVGRMQSHLRWEVEAVQMFVLRHPLLAGALRWVSNHLEQIEQVTLMGIAIGEKLIDKPDKGKTTPDETKAELAQQFDEAVGSLPEQINRAAMQLAELRLPEKVLPLGEVVEVIVQIILSRLGAKYKVVGAVILKLLDIAGKKKDVFDAIASLIPEELDPNHYWEEDVVKPVDPWLNDAKNALIDEFYDQILHFGLFQDKAKTLEAGRGKAKNEVISTEHGDLPEQEVQPHGLLTSDAIRGPAGPLPAPGPPLDPAIRFGAESRFGHDFSHVRLATGESGGNFASRFGADAVTSGSLVYLRQGLSPSAGAGARILNHELTHVLQQTGPRPLGGDHGSRPVAGQPGCGLVIDPVSEKAADRVARIVGNQHGSAPVPVGPGRKGWQPALPYNVIRGLLDDVTGTGDIEQDEAKVDQTGATTGAKKLPSKQKQRITDFPQNLREAIQACNDFTAPFNEVQDDIKNQVLVAGPSGETNFRAIENALADLTEDSLRERKAKEGEVKESEPQVVAHVDSKRFAVALARYIFGRTGILMEFDLLPADRKDEETAITVSNVKVLYVHLPPVRANHSLWTKATAGLVGKNQEESDLLADKDRLFRRLRLYLESKGPAPGIWKPKTYGLQQRVLSELVEFVKAMAAGNADLSPAELPGKKEYLDPKGTPGPSGHIGLRIGTYKDSGNQQGKDRESHHTTQFLLLEYFAHKNDTQKTDDSKPFPLISKRADIYPGLDATGGVPSKFTGASLIDIARLAKGTRGDAMPAILLARPTHRNGSLHVTTKADDFDDKTDSPAGVVSFVFHEKLGGASSLYRKAEVAGVNEFDAFKKSAGEDTVKVQIYTAMQETYKWMRDFMRERLDKALPSIEMKYYNQLAEDGGKKDRLKASEMLFVATEAKANNDAVMAGKGWVG